MHSARFASSLARAVRAALVTSIAVAGLVVGAPPAIGSPSASSASRWMLPVDGAVIRPFVEPLGPYGPGHRGVDLAAAPGTPVRAAGAGQVTFAGAVAGSEHVVVLHEGGLRTSYSFLAQVSVRAGAAVVRGDVVGTSGGHDDATHDGSVLHFGLRLGERYLDPMLLFAPVDLAAVVRLVPSGENEDGSWSPEGERRAIATWVVDGVPTSAASSGDAGGCSGGIPIVGGAVDALCQAASFGAAQVDAGVESAMRGLRGATGMAAGLAGRLGRTAARFATMLRAVPAQVGAQLLRTPLGMLVSDLTEMGMRLWGATHTPCTNEAPPADGTGGSAHRVMVVGGINSEGAAGTRPTNRLDVDALGYLRDDGEVRYFSYAADGGRYGPEDTYGDLLVAAERLGVQLREMQREQPGREVDLIAHSQGGVIVDLFLSRVYEPGDRDYPPLGTVVTLSSPHEGAPAATAAAAIRRTALGRLLADEVVADRVPLLPPFASPAVQQFSEQSPLIRDLWSRRLPDHVDFTTVGAAEDPIVPANRISVPGAAETVVAVDAPSPHTAILTDADALRAVRAALEHRELPCVGLTTALRAAVSPVLITRTIGIVGGSASQALGGVGR